ncbi:hypothetical protein B566_EDAN001292 [Ephemera danica]|nr:hypothetical protein B566_EDAN001292 [Ephemera danica]
MSKSFLGFVTFNIITYSLLLAELVTTSQLAQGTPEERSFYTHVFNGCYAVLLFIVVIFFLIYGVEVFFKSACFVLQLRGGFTEGLPRKVDTSQLHQSRVGLVSQAIMLFIVVGFLCSETLSEFWKQKVPVVSRNWHDIVFHVVEIGAVLWFPCVLWNCMSPEQLWILNPKKLLKKLELPKSPAEDKEDASDKDSDSEGESEEEGQDCWICYDPDRRDAGPLIRPCQCRGDVSSVHHDCLRRWLVESAAEQASEGEETNANLRCKVCGSCYQVERGSRLDWQQGFTPQHWLRTAAIVTAMCLSGAGAWVLVQLYTEPGLRLLAIGFALLVIYVGIRFLGLNTVTAYQRAKVSALNIMGQSPGPSTPSSSSSSNSSLVTITPPLATISETVSVSIPSSHMPSKKKQLAMQTQI